MIPRSLPVLACSICYTLAFGLPAPAAEPSIQFRWLQTDLQNADALVNAIKANNLAAAAFGAQIDQQVKGKKITEVAVFNEKIASGMRFVLKPATDKIPLEMEAQATVSENSYVDLRYAPEWTPKTSKGSGLLRINAATTLSGQRWHLLGRWSDGKTDTLLLSCCSGLAEPNPAAEGFARAAHPPVVIHLDAEWRETTAADLAKVAQAPAESRRKALTWLRGRSKLLANVAGACKSGQKSTIEYLWGGKTDAELEQDAEKHNEDPMDPPPRPGVIFEWEPAFEANDKLPATVTPATAIEETVAKVDQLILSRELNLRLSATYVALKSKGKSPEMEFVFDGKLRPGVPEFVAAKAAPRKDQSVVVLVLTPWYDIIR